MSKRLILALIFGFICGLICLALGHFAGGAELTPRFIAGGLFNRTLMGLVIGLIAWKYTPYVRGPLFGLIMSIGPAIGMTQNQVPYLVAGMIYGFLIDVLTSKVFKADVA
jgi:hypothetical protein